MTILSCWKIERRSTRITSFTIINKINVFTRFTIITQINLFTIFTRITSFTKIKITRTARLTRITGFTRFPRLTTFTSNMNHQNHQNNQICQNHQNHQIHQNSPLLVLFIILLPSKWLNLFGYLPMSIHPKSESPWSPDSVKFRGISVNFSAENAKPIKFGLQSGCKVILVTLIWLGFVHWLIDWTILSYSLIVVNHLLDKS